MTNIVIQLQVDNSDWSEDEFDEQSDRKIIIQEHQLKDYLYQRGDLNAGEFIHQIIRIETND